MKFYDNPQREYQEEVALLEQEDEVYKLVLHNDDVNTFDFVIEIDPSIDIKNTYIVPMILQPFVENAIKHGLLHKQGDKKIDVSFQLLDSDTIRCEVVDNGVGREKSFEINKNKKRTSFAVDANLNRLELLNQKFSNKIGLEIVDLYEDNLPIGTKVILTLPIFK